MGNVRDVTLTLEAGEADITMLGHSGWALTSWRPAAAASPCDTFGRGEAVVKDWRAVARAVGGCAAEFELV